MIINVKVIANAKQNKVKEEGNRYKVYLMAPPVEGRANRLLIEVLSGYFKVKKSGIKIISGILSKNKTLEVIDK